MESGQRERVSGIAFKGENGRVLKNNSQKWPETNEFIILTVTT
jgi:hypothetical protein